MGIYIYIYANISICIYIYIYTYIRKASVKVLWPVRWVVSTQGCTLPKMSWKKKNFKRRCCCQVPARLRTLASPRGVVLTIRFSLSSYTTEVSHHWFPLQLCGFPLWADCSQQAGRSWQHRHLSWRQVQPTETSHTLWWCAVTVGTNASLLRDGLWVESNNICINEK